VLLYLWFLKSFFYSSFCVAMSDFIYHYLLASLYVFVILVVENDLKIKSFSLSNIVCTKFIPFYHLII
jgi:hypothetical protein